MIFHSFEPRVLLKKKKCRRPVAARGGRGLVRQGTKPYPTSKSSLDSVPYAHVISSPATMSRAARHRNTCSGPCGVPAPAPPPPPTPPPPQSDASVTAEAPRSSHLGGCGGGGGMGRGGGEGDEEGPRASPTTHARGTLSSAHGSGDATGPRLLYLTKIHIHSKKKTSGAEAATFVYSVKGRSTLCLRSNHHS